MTSKQKDIVRKLLDGHSIVGTPRHGFRLRDQKQNVVAKFNYNTFFRIKNILRRQRDCFVINKSKVRQLHGRSFIKQYYKKQMLNSAACEPCKYEPIKKEIFNRIKRPRKQEIENKLESQLPMF